MAKREVEADAQARMFVSESDSFFGGGTVDHKAGGGEDAALMGLDNGAIDRMGAAEIVGVYDKAASWGGHWMSADAVIWEQITAPHSIPHAQDEENFLGFREAGFTVTKNIEATFFEFLQKTPIDRAH